MQRSIHISSVRDINRTDIFPRVSPVTICGRTARARSDNNDRVAAAVYTLLHNAVYTRNRSSGGTHEIPGTHTISLDAPSSGVYEKRTGQERKDDCLLVAGTSLATLGYSTGQLRHSGQCWHCALVAQIRDHTCYIAQHTDSI